ncbi:MAG TPA: dephospho-CoA kinase [Clostridiaceae bacterium]|nr:dephospho-CoA kinase [Clostridiaceae bacterium]
MVLLMVIGITGGIGSGKSTVSKILRDLGAKVIDADRISREVTAKGKKAYDEIVDTFGSGVLNEDGELDRKKLADIVFNDQEKLKLLEGIVHKYVIEEIEKRVNAAKNEWSSDIIVLDVPIPVKRGFIDLVDQVWVVTCDMETRIKRIMERSGYTYEEAVKRINSQMKEDEYLKIADEVLVNNGSIEELENSVAKLYIKIRSIR